MWSDLTLMKCILYGVRTAKAGGRGSAVNKEIENP